jgi:nucleoside-diphosphate-sugar epimerase
MRVMLTGNEGYLGSVIGPQLVELGHDVVGLDTGLFKNGWLYRGDGRVTPATIVKDIRQVVPADFRGFEAVVHMAELSNDPMGQLDPSVTRKVNHSGTMHLAHAAREGGVRRFVHMSSCSVYGVAADDEVAETSPTNPQTVYAECKVLVERDLSEMAESEFVPTFLRNATAYGASPRMRFDVVLNNLAGLAWTRKRIAMTSDGSPWRPLVHVLDIGQAIHRVLVAPEAEVSGQILNVGSSGQNYRVREIAEIVAEVFPGCEISFGTQGGDNRSYRVSFDKIRAVLPGFECQWDIRRGAEQLRTVFERVGLTSEMAEGRGHIRLKQLEHLIVSGQVDRELFWIEGN